MTIIKEVQKKYKRKKEFQNLQKKLFNETDEVINFFEKGTFPYKGNVFKTKEESEEKSEKNKFFECIANESKRINYDLFGKHFSFVVPTVLAKKIYETKYKNKNNELVSAIKSGLPDLKDEIKKMCEDEKKN